MDMNEVINAFRNGLGLVDIAAQLNIKPNELAAIVKSRDATLLACRSAIFESADDLEKEAIAYLEDNQSPELKTAQGRMVLYAAKLKWTRAQNRRRYADEYLSINEQDREAPVRPGFFGILDRTQIAHERYDRFLAHAVRDDEPPFAIGDQTQD